jgi:catechol 2,3-dioxygenase-like lactoylglutathione lyase family enzyme
VIRVDHVGVPARDRREAAGFLASLFDLDREVVDDGRFARLRISPEFTLVFYESEQIQPTHVAFVVDGTAFDAILRRLQSQGVAYGSQPSEPTNNRIDHPLSERGLFFQMPDGHLFELMASNSGAT